MIWEFFFIVEELVLYCYFVGGVVDLIDFLVDIDVLNLGKGNIVNFFFL